VLSILLTEFFNPNSKAAPGNPNARDRSKLFIMLFLLLTNVGDPNFYFYIESRSFFLLVNETEESLGDVILVALF
jgi:hypothetical protein